MIRCGVVGVGRQAGRYNTVQCAFSDGGGVFLSVVGSRMGCHSLMDFV